MIRSLLAAAALLPTAAHAAVPVQVPDRTIAGIEADLAAHRTTSEALVRAALARIAAMDHAGPQLHAVIATNPHALADARALDAERRAGHVRGPLHGVPILVKDNIETLDPMPTTAGSLALKDNITHRDAPLVARLREGGAIILGKTNLSEWANMRSPHSTSGWSATGGLVRNPYVLDRNNCGSSSGSGAAVAAGYAVAAIGSETDGSVTCPASVAGLVGIKPTVGLVSRTHVVPISHTQDTAGPMATSVADAAALLTVMAGTDPADSASAEADAKKSDYSAALNPAALKGARIGVLRFASDLGPDTNAVFERALASLRSRGAELVEIKDLPGRELIGPNELTVLITELKQDLDAYLASTPTTVPVRTMAQLIAFDRAHADAEMPWFGQEFFEQAEASKGYDADYRKAAGIAREQAGAKGIDKMMADNKVVALVAPTYGPAWTTDYVNGDHVAGGDAVSLAAVAGYPHVSVPMGAVHGLPVGLSFLGAKWDEARLIGLAYAYEQATHARTRPTYLPSLEAATR